jgi:hypothetical protein
MFGLRTSSRRCYLADTCDGSGNCLSNPAPTTTLCRAIGGLCDVEEYCDGAGACPVDSFVVSGTECRASVGICDVSEQCTGASASCPTDVFLPATTECRSAVGLCVSFLALQLCRTVPFVSPSSLLSVDRPSEPVPQEMRNSTITPGSMPRLLALFIITGNVPRLGLPRIRHPSAIFFGLGFPHTQGTTAPWNRWKFVLHSMRKTWSRFTSTT